MFVQRFETCVDIRFKIFSLEHVMIVFERLCNTPSKDLYWSLSQEVRSAKFARSVTLDP
jgi:hypothetical protein